MIFESVGPSAVKSILQRDFLKEWIRNYLPHRTLPALVAFKPSRLGDEMPELMFYDVEYIEQEPHYRVTHEGKRLIDAYGVTGIGRYLQNNVNPAVWVYLQPLYSKCVTSALPIYSIFHVTDTEGRKVDYERLLLPFGEGSAVRQIVASIKSISVDGRFVNTDLMAPINHHPQYTLRAVINAGLEAPPRTSGNGDVVER